MVEQLELVSAGELSFYVRNKSDASVVDEVVNHRTYEKPRLGMLLLPNDRVLDCGAHIGTFSIWCERMRRCKALAVEATGDNYEMILKNARLNRCEMPVLHNAVTVRPGESVFRFNPETPSRSSSFASKGKEERVKNAPIAELIGEFEPTVIKMDIEGGELPILDAGMPLEGVRAVMMEYHFRFDKSCANARRRIEPLKKKFRYSSVPSSVYKCEQWPSWLDAMMYFWN